MSISNISFSQGQVQIDGPAVATGGQNCGTFTVPCGVTEIFVQVWGGGGAGGAADGNGDMGSGAGSGAYSEITLTVTAGDQFDYCAGAGGEGGSNDGPNGEPSTFINVGGAPAVNINAGGGLGGGQNSGAAGGAATSSGGTLNVLGIPGTVGVAIVGPSGSGGQGPNGGGPGGQGSSGCADGNPGFGPGGGGAGANHDCNGGANSGGNGGNGVVLISWAPISAGADAVLSSCITSMNLNATPAPAGLTGTWTISPADGSTVVPATSEIGVFTAATVGETYTLTWTMTGACISAYDEITIVTTGPLADAGFDQNLCAGSYTMMANTPEAGFTGTWSVFSEPSGGDITIAPGDMNNPNAPVTSLMSQGECATLVWTVSGLCSESDTIQICNPLTCNDDPCGAVVLPLNATCVPQTFAGAINGTVTETQNPGEPGCGRFSDGEGTSTLYTANDIWYSVGPVPADGTMNIDLNGAAGDYVSASIYEGTSCNDLELLSCHQNLSSGGALNIQEANLTPGSTVYIRVWDYYDYTPVDVTICAHTTPTDSDILPGDNLITCGNTYNFYDLGGSTGNYGNNAQVVYTICPDDPSQTVSANFTTMAMSNTDDHMIALNGSQPTAPVIADFYSGTPTIISTSTDGCITFIFQSGYNTNNAGWAATVTCVTPDPVNDAANHLTNTCAEQNCLGGCLRTLCGIPSVVGFQGDGFGNQELNENTNGCWGTGERCSNWFYINPQSSGDLSLNLFVNNGQDQDFLIWELFGDSLQCPAETGQEPLLCNFAGATSQGTGFNDALTATNPAFEPSLQISQDDIDNEIYYIVNIQTYNNGGACPQPDVTTTFGGTVDLGCSAPVPLGLDIVEFDGMPDGDNNALFWKVAVDVEVSHYTLERSRNMQDWEKIGKAEAENTTEGHVYRMKDSDPYWPFTYYRVRQVDFNGINELTHVISIRRGDLDNNWASPLFPNPANDYVSFQYQGDHVEEPLSVSIFNSVGQLVYVKEFANEESITIDTRGLALGSYQVHLNHLGKKDVRRMTVVR